MESEPIAPDTSIGCQDNVLKTLTFHLSQSILEWELTSRKDHDGQKRVVISAIKDAIDMVGTLREGDVVTHLNGNKLEDDMDIKDFDTQCQQGLKDGHLSITVQRGYSFGNCEGGGAPKLNIGASGVAANSANGVNVFIADYHGGTAEKHLSMSTTASSTDPQPEPKPPKDPQTTHGPRPAPAHASIPQLCRTVTVQGRLGVIISLVIHNGEKRICVKRFEENSSLEGKVFTGDLILQLNGQDLRNMTLPNFADMLKDTGTERILTVHTPQELSGKAGTSPQVEHYPTATQPNDGEKALEQFKQEEIITVQLQYEQSPIDMKMEQIKDNKGYIVTDIDKGSPASEQIILGDVLTHFNGTSLIGVDHIEFNRMMHAQKNTLVDLTVIRNSKTAEEHMYAKRYNANISEAFTPNKMYTESSKSAPGSNQRGGEKSTNSRIDVPFPTTSSSSNTKETGISEAETARNRTAQTNSTMKGNNEKSKGTKDTQTVPLSQSSSITPSTNIEADNAQDKDIGPAQSGSKRKAESITKVVRLLCPGSPLGILLERNENLKGFLVTEIKSNSPDELSRHLNVGAIITHFNSSPLQNTDASALSRLFCLYEHKEIELTIVKYILTENTDAPSNKRSKKDDESKVDTDAKKQKSSPAELPTNRKKQPNPQSDKVTSPVRRQEPASIIPTMDATNSNMSVNTKVVKVLPFTGPLELDVQSTDKFGGFLVKKVYEKSPLFGSVSAGNILTHLNSRSLRGLKAHELIKLISVHKKQIMDVTVSEIYLTSTSDSTTTSDSTRSQSTKRSVLELLPNPALLNNVAPNHGVVNIGIREPRLERPSNNPGVMMKSRFASLSPAASNATVQLTGARANKMGGSESVTFGIAPSLNTNQPAGSSSTLHTPCASEPMSTDKNPTLLEIPQNPAAANHPIPASNPTLVLPRQAGTASTTALTICDGPKAISVQLAGSDLAATAPSQENEINEGMMQPKLPMIRDSASTSAVTVCVRPRDIFAQLAGSDPPATAPSQENEIQKVRASPGNVGTESITSVHSKQHKEPTATAPFQENEHQKVRASPGNAEVKYITSVHSKPQTEMLVKLPPFDGPFGIHLVRLKRFHGFVVKAFTEDSPCLGKIELGSVITHLNSKSLHDTKAKEFKALIAAQRKSGLTLTLANEKVGENEVLSKPARPSDVRTRFTHPHMEHINDPEVTRHDTSSHQHQPDVSFSAPRTVNIPTAKGTLGIIVRYVNKLDGLLVILVSEQSPLEGVVAGDVITHINTKPLKGRNINECLFMIQYATRKSFLTVKHILHFEGEHNLWRMKFGCGLSSPKYPSHDSQKTNQVQKRVQVNLGSAEFKCKRIDENGMVVSDIDPFCTKQTELQKGDVLEEIDGHQLNTLDAQTLRRLQITKTNGTREAVVIRESTEEIENKKAASKEAGYQVMTLKRIDVPNISLGSLPTSFSFYTNDKESEEIAIANNKRFESAKKKSAAKKPNKTSRRRRSAHLPKGWTEEVFTRSPRGTYKYFFSPEQKYKFRSKKGVISFLSALEKTRGNELEAYKLVKNSIR